MTDADREALLAGLQGEARAARDRLLAALEREGVTPEELRQATEEGRLALLLAERRLGTQARHTPREVADVVGLELDFLLALRRAQGLPVPDPDQRTYSDADLDGARSVRRFLDVGVTPDAVLEMTRLLGRGFAQAAEAMRATTFDLILDAGLAEDRVAERFAEVAVALRPLITPTLGHLGDLHLQHVVTTELVSALESGARLADERDVAVCFADLVGFTRVGEEVPPERLGRIAARLEELASAHVAPPVRFVKTIGDAVMLVSPDPAGLVHVALDLVAAADAEGEDFPQLRAGITYGPALSRAGDWFGATVNLASRVCGRARPGSVLATDAVRRAMPADGVAWSPAGEKRLRGVREPVRLVRARRAA